MSRVVLHIGLHKTATRFLQRALFRNLDASRFLVNPDVLMDIQRRAMRKDVDEIREEYLAAARRACDEAGSRTLVISDPEISGHMFRNHENYAANLDLVRRAFPEATIIYFVRGHADWLHSAYRQVLVKGRAFPIQLFLSFRDGAFRPPLARRVNGVRTIDALGLRFLEIYRAYADAFGPESVYLFRQEDLRARPGAVHARLAEALGLPELPELPTRAVSGNRAFSALALKLFFPGTRYMPDLSRAVLGDAPIPPKYVNLGRPLRKVRTLFVRHVFDRLIYRDWDLLAADGMREQLDAHYATDEHCLEVAAQVVLDKGPGVEARRAAEAGSDVTSRSATPRSSDSRA